MKDPRDVIIEPIVEPGALPDFDVTLAERFLRETVSQSDRGRVNAVIDGKMVCDMKRIRTYPDAG